MTFEGLNCGLCKKPLTIAGGYTFGCHKDCVRSLIQKETRSR